MFDVVLIMAVVLVAGILVARRLQAQKPVELDWATRYRRHGFALVCYGTALAMMIADAFRRPDLSGWKNRWALALMSLTFVLFLYQFLKARKKMREQPEYLRQKKKPLPQFFWQAVFILLPVALMAAFGFWAILHQRRAVEQDAQQRAQDILHALPDEFGRSVANRLTQLDGSKGGWFQYLQGGVAAWPGDKNRKAFLDDPNETEIISNNLASLHAAFPEWHEGPPPLVDFSLDTNGDSLFGIPNSFPPRPPAWLAEMSVDQQQAWADVQAADAKKEPMTAESVSNAVNVFRATRPPAAALASAQFLQIRAGLSALPATNAIDKLMRFAGRHYNEISESGIPLKTLALAVALQRAHDCGAGESLWRQLQSEISTPNTLTPLLLDDAARLVAGNPQLEEGIGAMRILLADKLAQSEMAEAVRQTGKLNGITTTNLWLEVLGRRWFCVLSPSESQMHTSVSNRPVTITSAITQVQCYPESLVIRGFAEALGDAKVSLPDYFAISCELEGETVSLPAPWSRFGDEKIAGNTLAEQHFQMNQPAMMMGHAADGSQKETMFEAMPGHPRFTLQIRLTDRNLLYARQRQLQWIFGSLIGLSVFSALVGFGAAYRAFRRQTQLNELKSNFVSSVSHELRAPIASVRLMAENLERGKIPETARQGEYFRFIVQECRRLSSLIENVLDFSRIEQGRKQYELEPTNLAALAETTVKLMEPYAVEKGVMLRLAGSSQPAAPGDLEMDVDGRAIQQALVNLIDNAVKHSPKGETVTVEINKSTDAIGLSVADHGPGIPAGEREKIFERFYRLGSELRRETQGVGIGLSVVKHIVEAHGGRILVESEIGRGSRFTIALPVKNGGITNGHE